jgi:hypothetical protein
MKLERASMFYAQIKYRRRSIAQHRRLEGFGQKLMRHVYQAAIGTY